MPIGVRKYYSRITRQEEELPVTIGIIAAAHCEGMLADLVKPKDSTFAPNKHATFPPEKMPFPFFTSPKKESSSKAEAGENKKKSGDDKKKKKKEKRRSTNNMGSEAIPWDQSQPIPCGTCGSFKQSGAHKCN
ncbi:hypothetical protein F4778DRAFT_786246 [Xylariomycetidae sp. FL2044]|nr:hypothetical protein F4778DRAFT_786246 [Xylariomycetidae sp. FL2044]